MWKSFLAFNQNAISNFLYTVTGNIWFVLLLIGVTGTIFFMLKEEVDDSVCEEQGIL